MKDTLRGQSDFQKRENRAKMEADPVLLFDNLPSDSNRTYELLTIPEVAAYFRVSVSEIRRLQYGRKLPFIKVGGSVRFARSDLVAYLAKCRVESIG
jgi:excisionase family DNA binding protein